ncbi:MAG: ABC transporter permease [Brooklawnia sp.]|jgi:ABC-type nitrate/sulfonate/bicarbonate transport system permease component
MSWQWTNRWRLLWPPLVVVVGLLGILQWLTSTGVIRDFVIPAPSAVADVLVTQFDLLLPHLLETTRVSLIGLAVSVLVGVAVALAMDRIGWVYRAFYPLVVASQTIPILVITPVIVLLFGYGLTPKILVVVLVCFFPICISLFGGLRAVDSDQLRMVHTMGASPWQAMWHVKLPGSLPGLFSGLKISATYCVMAATLAEWSGGSMGLGIYMLRTKRSYSYDRMFASIVLIIVVSMLFYLAVAGLQRASMPWRAAERTARQQHRLKD